MAYSSSDVVAASNLHLAEHEKYSKTVIIKFKVKISIEMMTLPSSLTNINLRNYEEVRTIREN